MSIQAINVCGKRKLGGLHFFTKLKMVEFFVFPDVTVQAFDPFILHYCFKTICVALKFIIKALILILKALRL